MAGKIYAFIVALFVFIVGLYLSAHGLPTSEEGAVLFVGNAVLDAIDDSADSENVSGFVENAKAGIAILGLMLTIASLITLVVLGIAAFR
jgi:hypothetical protein